MVLLKDTFKVIVLILYPIFFLGFTDPEKIYQTNCASCHEGGVAKAPHRMFLEMMPTDAIYSSLTEGIMISQAKNLSAESKEKLAEHLSKVSLTSLQQVTSKRCKSSIKFGEELSTKASGWGFELSNSRFQNPKLAGMDASDVTSFEPIWAFAFPNSQRVRSQPFRTGNTIFIGSQDGRVYAIDHNSGCIHWIFRASAEVRTAVSVVRDSKGRALAYFGDLLAQLYVLDAVSGELIWKKKIDDHSNATFTGTPISIDGVIYAPLSSLEVTSAADPNYKCCTFRGSLNAINLLDGELVWKSYTVKKTPRQIGTTSIGTPIIAPSGAPIWTTVTFDESRNRLYLGTGENYSSPSTNTSDSIIAFNISNGNIVWATQMTSGDAWNMACMEVNNPNCPIENGPDQDFGAGPVLISLTGGKDILVAGQKSGDVWGLDPQNGSIVWSKKLGRGGIQGGIHFGLAADGEKVFVPISDMSWGEEEVIAVHGYTGKPTPGLYALNARTGETLWYTKAPEICDDREFCNPGISAAISAIDGVVFAGHMDGHIRAYNSSNGSIIWDFDTVRKFDSVTGIKGFGGSIGGSGPLPYKGILYLSSGYSLYGHMPGNVLIAFGNIKSTK
ncbi:MAG TPA: dehydrogenase [Gammaproteobacteria bacterium]|nr:dehydrogenase [Gammaproteobacteria bacterium]